MALKKLSELDDAAALENQDILPIVQSEDYEAATPSFETFKTTAKDVVDFVGSKVANTATAELNYDSATPTFSVDVLDSPLLAGATPNFYRKAWMIGSSSGNVNVVNTVTETALAAYTIPGGTLAPGDRLRFVLMGEASAVSDTVNQTVRVKFGSTTVLATPGSTSITANANPRLWKMEIDLLATSTSLQQIGATMLMSVGSGNTMHNIGGSSPFNIVGRNGCAEDTSTDKVFSVTVEAASASPNISWDCRASFVEILKA